MEFEHEPIEDNPFSKSGQPLARPLYADFDFYTEGDQDYKKELILLMINNLIEFRQTVFVSLDQRNAHMFLEARHKAKVTFSILADKEFDEAIDQIHQNVVEGAPDNALRTRSNNFFSICDMIVISLRKEITGPGM